MRVQPELIWCQPRVVVHCCNNICSVSFKINVSIKQGMKQKNNFSSQLRLGEELFPCIVMDLPFQITYFLSTQLLTLSIHLLCCMYVHFVLNHLSCATISATKIICKDSICVQCRLLIGRCHGTHLLQPSCHLQSVIYMSTCSLEACSLKCKVVILY